MLGDVLDPPASTRPKYALEAPEERPTPGSPLKKALILALVALSSGLLLVLPEDGEQSYALDTEAETAVVSGPSTGIDSADAANAAADAADSSTPSSMTEVAGETGFSSEADTARLALATEAALVGSDPNLAGSALALSLADELALAEQAMAALSPTATTQAPTTTAATTPPTTAAPSTEATTTVPETTAGATENDAAEAATTGTETTDGETTVPETATSEGAESETTESETTGAETTTPETTTPETATSETTAPETTTPETTTPETTAPATSATDGWVDTGNGVMVPPVLLAIRWCESTDNYTAANPSSSARGAYQFLTGSWDAYGHKDRYGVSQAHLATPVQQDEAALITWERDGTRPWNASKSCWSKRI